MLPILPILLLLLMLPAGAASAAPADVDRGFGRDGRVTIDFGGDDDGYAVAVQPDGKLVVVGERPRSTTGRSRASMPPACRIPASAATAWPWSRA